MAINARKKVDIKRLPKKKVKRKTPPNDDPGPPIDTPCTCFPPPPAATGTFYPVVVNGVPGWEAA